MINYSKTDFNIHQLGSFYQADKTVFRVFAPESQGLLLHISSKTFEMHKKGLCFEIAIGGNLEGFKYFYENDNGIYFKDPFAYYSDERYSYILNTDRFISEKIEVNPKKTTVIYETSVRDFSCDDSFPSDVRRKFLSFTIEDLKINNYYMVGLDYLKNLGVSHIQLLPVFSYDLDKADYNWGYNPLAYNLIHKAYVLNDKDPYAYTNELRKMVNCLHSNGMKVTLDVVFNHVYKPAWFDLEKMLKGHTFRIRKDGKLANGTFCGSEVKSEDPFIREYIVEMTRRYIRLFDIDGLRLDLMGIMDYETVNEMFIEARKIKTDFIMYGEGWNMGDVLDESKRASLNNADKLKGIGMFNDFYRETLIQTLVKNNINIDSFKQVLSGNSNNLNPDTSINYVECHDNNTFFDRLMIERGDTSLEHCVQRCKLALGLILVSRGIPFIHSGQEFLRTKHLVENSYNKPEEINKLDWLRRCQYNDICDYTKSLIGIRNKYDFTGEVSFKEYEPVLEYCVGKMKVFINLSDKEMSHTFDNSLRIVFNGTEECDISQSDALISPYSLIICTD